MGERLRRTKVCRGHGEMRKHNLHRMLAVRMCDLVGSPTHLDMERAGDYVGDDEVDQRVTPRPTTLEQCTKPTPKEGDTNDL